MTIDLDTALKAAVDAVMDWDLLLTLNGVGRRVRPMAVADLSRFLHAERDGEQAMRALLADILAAAPAEAAELSFDQVKGALLAVASYLAIKKNQAMSVSISGAIRSQLKLASL